MYKINELAKLSGVSTRTLRYYHEIGLLMPEKVDINGYRIYGQVQVDELQQILFYRELDIPLEEIKILISVPDYNKEHALESHLIALLNKKEQIELLINNVKKTICLLRGETTMANEEKFEGFKKNIIDNNEKKYGEEIRKLYGDESVDASYKKIKGMSHDQWNESQKLSEDINKMLLIAFTQGNPEGEVAQEVCKLHEKWLRMFWKDGMYTKDAHIGLAEGYVLDERFTAYYDQIAEGCTKFLRDAIKIYCSK